MPELQQPTYHIPDNAFTERSPAEVPSTTPLSGGEVLQFKTANH